VAPSGIQVKITGDIGSQFLVQAGMGQTFWFNYTSPRETTDKDEKVTKISAISEGKDGKTEFTYPVIKPAVRKGFKLKSTITLKCQLGSTNPASITPTYTYEWRE
jgi:hypothetical protein